MRLLSLRPRKLEVKPRKRGDNWTFRAPERPLLLGLTVLFMLFVVGPLASEPGGSVIPVELLAFVLGLGGIWWGWRSWLLGITATPSEVKFYGLFGTRRVSWDQIGRFEIGSFGRLERATIGAILKDGSVACVRNFSAGAAPPDSDIAQTKFGAATNGLNALLLEHVRKTPPDLAEDLMTRSSST